MIYTVYGILCIYIHTYVYHEHDLNMYQIFISCIPHCCVHVYIYTHDHMIYIYNEYDYGHVHIYEYMFIVYT